MRETEATPDSKFEKLHQDSFNSEDELEDFGIVKKPESLDVLKQNNLAKFAIMSLSEHSGNPEI